MDCIGIFPVIVRSMTHSPITLDIHSGAVQVSDFAFQFLDPLIPGDSVTDLSVCLLLELHLLFCDGSQDPAVAGVLCLPLRIPLGLHGVDSAESWLFLGDSWFHRVVPRNISYLCAGRSLLGQAQEDLLIQDVAGIQNLYEEEYYHYNSANASWSHVAFTLAVREIFNSDERV